MESNPHAIPDQRTADAGLLIGAGWDDFKNDGFLDPVVTSWQGQTNAFYQNNGKATFTETPTFPGEVRSDFVVLTFVSTPNQLCVVL